MEEIKWDREAFVQQQKKRPSGPSMGPSLAGIILFVLTLGVLGGGVYWYLTTQGYATSLPPLSFPSIGNSQSSELAQKLDEFDARLAQIEKRLNITAPAKPGTATSASTRPAPRAGAARPAASASQSARASQAGAASSSPAAGASLATAPAPSDADLVATREAWEATTDRLGMAVGEMGNQRREIARTQEDLEQLRRNFQRTYVPFQLSKEAGRQRVGPVLIALQGTDNRNQRYSVSLQFDDRTVQMKDRALGEKVEFYVAGVQGPIELVVSDIQQDRISGQLAVPPSEGVAAR